MNLRNRPNAPRGEDLSYQARAIVPPAVEQQTSAPAAAFPHPDGISRLQGAIAKLAPNQEPPHQNDPEALKGAFKTCWAQCDNADYMVTALLKLGAGAQREDPMLRGIGAAVLKGVAGADGGTWYARLDPEGQAVVDAATAYAAGRVSHDDLLVAAGTLNDLISGDYYPYSPLEGLVIDLADPSCRIAAAVVDGLANLAGREAKGGAHPDDRNRRPGWARLAVLRKAADLVRETAPPTFVDGLLEASLAQPGRRIRIAYEVYTEESVADGDAAERGWENEEGVLFENDEFNTAAEDAARFLKDAGASVMDGYYQLAFETRDDDVDLRTGDRTRKSFSLVGFTPEEEDYIKAKVAK